VPFSFEIRHAVMSGDLLVVAGSAETVVLYLPTRDPRGEVVWQEQEFGDIYAAPYLLGERLVSVRAMPFNLTVRYRSTGKLIGRLELPDLRGDEGHPLLDDEGPAGLPMARDGKWLALCSDTYYLLLDVEAIRVVWKRLIDVSNDSPLRVALNGDYLSVIKKDYDVKAIYMLSSRTGGVLWRTDPKDRSSPQPMYSMVIRNGKLFGIKDHPGQGFYFVGMDAATGKHLFRPLEQDGYQDKPRVRLRDTLYGNVLVAEIRDRQNFELKAFDVDKGRLLHTVKVEGVGDFGEHGRASATVQPGGLALLGKNEVRMAVAGE
jgi:outer membrane protein assembly factor BamB